jgi:DNA topoisomerase 2-associated protein PAT1
MPILSTDSFDNLAYFVALHSLQGALGKTSGRSYKAAPRQLLQVDAGNASPNVSPAHAHISKDDAEHRDGAAKEAAKLGREALGNAADVSRLLHSIPTLRS